MIGRADVRDVVDAFFKKGKILAGTGQWRPELNENSVRCVYPIEVEGEIFGLDLTIKAYPRAKVPKFRLILTYGKAIWRLDYADDDPHINSHNRPPDLPLGPIVGPHFHSWEDNRRFATSVALPSRLRNARPLPENVRSFENAFRWFCGLTGISVGSQDMPMLPKSDTLL